LRGVFEAVAEVFALPDATGAKQWQALAQVFLASVIVVVHNEARDAGAARDQQAWRRAWAAFAAVVFGHQAAKHDATAQREALDSLVLQEGLKAFNFSGASVSLDIDLTQAYEGLRSVTEQIIQDSVRRFKKELALRGVTGGDGDVDNPPHVTIGRAYTSSSVGAAAVDRRGTYRVRRY